MSKRSVLLFLIMTLCLGQSLYAHSKKLRIVSLAPSVTQLLIAAGAKNDIVAVTNYNKDTFKQTVVKVGPFGTPDVAKIASVKPDLIFITQKMQLHCDTPNSPLAKLGVPVIVIHDHDLMSVASVLERIGHIVGTYPQASRVAAHLRKEILFYQNSHAARAKPVPVFIQIHDNPLYTTGSETYVTQMVRLCGGKNIFPSKLAYFEVTPQQVLLKRPAAILDFVTEPQLTSIWDTSEFINKPFIYHLDPDNTLQYGPNVVTGIKEICQVMSVVRSRLQKQ